VRKIIGSAVCGGVSVAIMLVQPSAWVAALILAALSGYLSAQVDIDIEEE
tara:strand:- start:754 stop:903 length:150 start_codon:yes stop_codon:yes gene_type:complete